MHIEPNIPSILGIEHIKGDVFHSSKYKHRCQFSWRDVLILVCGETAMDIAYEAIKADAKSTTMCFRTDSSPSQKLTRSSKCLGGLSKAGWLPIDGLITDLFDTTHVHHVVAKSWMRWFVPDFVIKCVLWFLTGTQAGMNHHVGALPRKYLGGRMCSLINLLKRCRT
jgi:dimethylaniline monooxygenase (N-oxide forming)